MDIRGHHLLCLPGFRGRGYSRGFIDEMARAKKAFFSAHGIPVTLVDRPDIICEACPHLDGDACGESAGAEERLNGKDREVIHLIGARVGETYPSDKLVQAMRLAAPRMALETLCADCDWLEFGHCRDGLDRLASGSSPVEID